MSVVRWTHLSLKLQHGNEKSPQLQRTRPHPRCRFAALGSKWTCMVPIACAGSQGLVSRYPPFTTQMSLPHFAQECLPNLLPGSCPLPTPGSVPRGQCRHLAYDKPISFLCTNVSLQIIENLKENNPTVVFFTKNISKVNNLLCLWQK